MKSDKKQIIDHIRRLEGQLASVREELQNDTLDCAKASSTLLSASRSFAGLRQKFTQSFLLKYFIHEKDTQKNSDLFKKLIALTKG